MNIIYIHTTTTYTKTMNTIYINSVYIYIKLFVISTATNDVNIVKILVDVSEIIMKIL